MNIHVPTTSLKKKTLPIQLKAPWAPLIYYIPFLSYFPLHLITTATKV